MRSGFDLPRRYDVAGMKFKDWRYHAYFGRYCSCNNEASKKNKERRVNHFNYVDDFDVNVKDEGHLPKDFKDG